MQEEKLYEIILSESLTWEGLIRDIVYSEGLNPWDIDIVKLTNLFLTAIKTMESLDLRVSGKFLLTAAILIKMKSDYLFPHVEESENEKEKKKELALPEEEYELEPNIPVPKKRKVTLDELMGALRKAMEVKQRREKRVKEKKVKIKIKLKKINIGDKIKDLYVKIVSLFDKFKTGELTFSNLIPSKQRKDQIWTFIPLVHLANQGKIKLYQEKCYGEIYVRKREQ